MAESELSELVASRSEDLSIEYKAWLDTSDPTARAKLARHIAALCNHGGGYLVFGIDDGTRAPMGEPTLDRGLFTQTKSRASFGGISIRGQQSGSRKPNTKGSDTQW